MKKTLLYITLSVASIVTYAQDAILIGTNYNHIRSASIDPARYTGYSLGMSHSNKLSPYLGYSGTFGILNQHADKLDIYGATGSLDANIYPFKSGLKAIIGFQIGITNKRR